MSKRNSITSCILVFLLLISFAGCCRRSPAEVAVFSIDALFEEAEKDGISGTVYDILHGGSVDAQVNISELAALLGAEPSSGLNIMANCTLFFDMYANKMAMLAALALDGEELIDAGVYLSANELIASSGAILNDDTYGISFPDDSERLLSILGGNFGFYGTGMAGQGITSLSLLHRLCRLEYDIESLKDKYMLLISELLTEHADVESINERVSYDTGSVRAQIISIKLDPDSLSSVLGELYDYICEDDDLYSVFDYLYDGTGIDLTEQLDNDDLEYTLELIEREDFELDIQFTVDRSDGSLMALDIDYDDHSDYDQDLSFKLLIGPDITKSTSVSARMNNDYTSLSAKYTVSEDSKKLYSSSLTLSNTSGSYEYSIKAAIDWDRSNGDLDLSLKEESDGDDGYKFKLRATMTDEGDEISIEPHKLDASDYYGYSYTYDLTGRLLLCRKNPVPAFPEYENFTDMSDDEIEELLESVANDLQDIISIISSTIYDGAYSEATPAGY